MSDIEFLRSEARRLQAELTDVRKRLEKAEIAAAEFQVGDVVEAACQRDDWRPAVVRKIQPNSWGPYYRVSFAKKNGDWSAAERQVFGKVRRPA